jgi:hypothetical protein
MAQVLYSSLWDEKGQAKINFPKRENTWWKKPLKMN